MTIRTALAPLVSGATYRRGVHLLLGGVILLPYILLVSAFVQMLDQPQAPRGVVGVLFVAAAVIAAVPAFLAGTRALEIAAARALLDVDLPEPTGGAIDRETRLRAALWFAAHLAAGGVVGLALLIALPMALVFVTQQFGVGGEALAGMRIGPFDEHDTGWLTLIGVVLLVAVVYLVAGLGALAAGMAPVLLGPSPTERIAALEARAGQLAERNRLARELHDSVGHALTVATLQAGAARELLDRDPEFVGRALTAIEETGRSAMEDLDYVLGVLREQGREQEPGQDSGPEAGETPGHGPGLRPGQRSPRRTLADLHRLVADTRAGGLPVTVEVSGGLDALPAAVSREGYRIVQEGLTNAARYAGREPITVRLAITERTLGIEVVNPVAERAGERRPATRTGRGLAGMRERVALLGGRMTAGREDGVWRVDVRLPVGRGRQA